MDRRKFLGSAMAGVGAAALGAPGAGAIDFGGLLDPLRGLIDGPPPRTNINHVVVMMMENRSTDHFLGWWGDRPDVSFDARTSLGPDGKPSGGAATANWGATSDPSFDQHRNYTGHGFGDPGHSHNTGRYQLIDDDGDGIPDGWGKPNTSTDRYALSYYTDADLPVLAQVVKDFTAFDRYFCSWMGNTFPNRYYMHSAQTRGIPGNDVPPQRAHENPDWAAGWDWPTLWDQLSAAGVTWTYYFSNLPVTALWGPRYLSNTRFITDYYLDAALGRLPQVCFVDPFFVVPEGLANDDHPHADIRLGQEFYSDVITAFMASPNWRRGALFINYDEWGGFWDHVVPPAVGSDVDPRARFGPGEVPDYTVEGDHTTGTPDFGLFGFRTPAFLLSPYARNTCASSPYVDRTISSVQDHTTILQFICDNWGLASPGRWDPGHSRNAPGSMLDAFDSSVHDPTDPGWPDVDIDAYRYQAPLEARANPYQINPATSVTALWAAADWIDSLGFTIRTRLADALPATRPNDPSKVPPGCAVGAAASTADPVGGPAPSGGEAPSSADDGRLSDQLPALPRTGGSSRWPLIGAGLLAGGLLSRARRQRDEDPTPT